MIKVLLADDDFLVRTYLSQLIDWEAHGYQLVGTAQDGEDAIQMMAEYHPQILITDISMPVMDGIEVIRVLRSRGDSVRIIALSCHDDFEYVKEAMRLGADEYVLKNLLTEQRLIELLEEMKDKLEVDREERAFLNSEQEQDYYLRLLGEENGTQLTKDGFYISAAMAVRLGNMRAFTVDQWERFNASFAQVCRESCGKTPVRCIHIRLEQYAVLLDLSGIASELEQRHVIQQKAEVLLRNSERYLALQLQIGTSRGGRSKQTPKQLWQEALDSLNGRFYHERPVFYGWQTRPCGKTLPDEAEVFAQSIGQYIKNKDGHAIRRGWKAALDAFEAENTRKELVCGWLERLEQEAELEAAKRPEQFAQMEEMADRFLGFEHEMLRRGEEYSEAVSRAIDYVHEHYRERISLNEVAEMVHLNATYLSHVFHKETGITFSEYLMSCRLNQAKELLQRPDVKLKDIGELSGFGNQRNFGKLFKTATGMSPREYRRQTVK